MVKREELIRYLDERLDIESVTDYSMNGLQVQGTDQIDKAALAVDAALITFRKAAEQKCPIILTHHGILWKSPERITGPFYEKIKFLINRNINLYAVHLPLDAHPELGNNAELARMMELNEIKPFGYDRMSGIHLGFSGQLPDEMTVEELRNVWRTNLACEPKVLPFGPKKIRKAAIVSGSAGNMLGEAIKEGLDCFITGEGSHPHYHQALEFGIHVIYLGHYHSEKPGIKALGKELEKIFKIQTVFIDEPTSF